MTPIIKTDDLPRFSLCDIPDNKSRTRSDICFVCGIYNCVFLSAPYALSRALYSDAMIDLFDSLFVEPAEEVINEPVQQVVDAMSDAIENAQQETPEGALVEPSETPEPVEETIPG